MELLAAGAVLLGSVAQAVTGFGFSLVASPFLVAAYDAPTGVQVNLLISTVLNIALLLAGWRHVDRPATVRLLVPAMAATVAVGLVVRGADTDGLTVLAGVLCLLAVVAVAAGRTLRRLTGPVGTVAVGGLAGAMNVVSGIGGPPVVLFGATAGWSPQVARPTLQAFFLGINVVGLATLGWPDRLPALAVPAMVVGGTIGLVAARRLQEHQVRAVVLLVAGAGSVLAIARGLA